MEEPSNEELGRRLRDQPFETKASWMRDAFLSNPRAAFDVGRRLRFSWREARQLVEETVHLADVSTARWWLEFYVSVAGLKRAIHMLDEWRGTPLEAQGDLAAGWVANLRESKTAPGRAQVEAWRRRRRSQQ